MVWQGVEGAKQKPKDWQIHARLHGAPRNARGENGAQRWILSFATPGAQRPVVEVWLAGSGVFLVKAITGVQHFFFGRRMLEVGSRQR